MDLPLNIYQPPPHQFFTVLCTTSLVISVRLEVFGAASVKCKVLRDVTPCRFVNSHQLLGDLVASAFRSLGFQKYTTLRNNTLILTAYYCVFYDVEQSLLSCGICEDAETQTKRLQNVNKHKRYYSQQELYFAFSIYLRLILLKIMKEVAFNKHFKPPSCLSMKLGANMRKIRTNSKRL
jgi:hypothetical protein